MIIDTDKIKALLASEITGYRLEQETGVKAQMISRYRNGDNDISNMSLKVATKLMNYINKGENKIKNTPSSD